MAKSKRKKSNSSAKTAQVISNKKSISNVDKGNTKTILATSAEKMTKGMIKTGKKVVEQPTRAAVVNKKNQPVVPIANTKPVKKHKKSKKDGKKPAMAKSVKEIVIANVSDGLYAYDNSRNIYDNSHRRDNDRTGFEAPDTQARVSTIAETIPTPAVNELEQPDYNTATFLVNAPELGFINLPDGNFAVRLPKGTYIKRRDALNFELRGTNPDGTPFGTLYDCIDEAEANAFLTEVIKFLADGSITITQAVAPTAPAPVEALPVVEPTLETLPPVTTSQPEPVFNANDYKDVPLNVENMNVLIDNLRTNDQNNSQGANAGVNINQLAQSNVTNIQPVTPAVNQPIIAAPMINNLPPNVQPAIAHTHTPDPNFNPQVPSQNPALTYQPNDLINQNFANQQHQNQHGVTQQQVTDEQVLHNMREYAHSIEGTINSSFQVERHGTIAQSEITAILKACDVSYTYELKNDGRGVFLTVTKGKYQLRVPEDFNQYLKTH